MEKRPPPTKMSKKHCIIVAGPTAVGKTAEAIRIAKALQTEIISADSRQCYRELNIGVARPTEEELFEVKHHFIANHSITETITAASFAKEALGYLNIIFNKCDHAVICGGTGLYIKALAEGLDDIPEVPEKVRIEVTSLFNEEGTEGLRKRLLELDPDYASRSDIHNPNRMMRALEVYLHTGSPIGSFQTGASQKRDFTIEYRILELPREQLYERINQRVDKMMETGLEEEAQSVLPYRDHVALQTVGYKELFDYFDGKCTREEAIEKIKQHTRNYAKRQITWFKAIGQE